MIVKIRDWDDMESEYGLDEDGDIKCYMRFTRVMESYIPKNRLIELPCLPNQYLGSHVWMNMENFGNYRITHNMIDWFHHHHAEVNKVFAAAKV